MILSPYQSSVCKRYSLDKIINQIMVERLNIGLYDRYTGIGVVTPRAMEVPVFTQPLTRLETGRTDHQDVILDGRTWLREAKIDGEYKYSINAHGEADLNILRARLQVLWMSDGFQKNDLRNVGDLAAIAFIDWISSTVANKLGLDLEKRLRLSVVVGYYYGCLFVAPNEFNDANQAKIAKVVARWVRTDINTVFTMIDGLQYLNDIDDFVAAIQKVVESSRTDQINVGLLYALLNSGWFGTNAQEMVSVALEHPPTWVALVYTSLKDRGYKKSRIAQTVLNSVRGGNDRDFLKGVDYLVKEFTQFDN